jgi:TPR repeat protein
MDRRFPGFGQARPGDDPPREGLLDPLPAVASAPDRASAEPRSALLIGNAAYGRAALRNPVRDVRLVGTALTQLGFTVTRTEDSDLATLHNAIADFVDSLEQSGPNTVALFYFAGHGVQADGVNYLIPVQADIRGKQDLRTQALALDDVVAMLSRSPRRANILVIDACRDDTLTQSASGQVGFSGGLASLSLPPAGMLVAYSTAAGKAANDGKGANSPYALALVETLPWMLEPGRRVHDILIETAEKVRDATGGRQSPALFLQGGLPALTLAPEDAGRRASYDPWGPARARKVALKAGLGITGLLLALLIALIWTRMQPIDKRAILALAGLADPPGIGLSCQGKPDAGRTDSYGLTAFDWCRLMPQDLHEKAMRTDGLASAIEAGLQSGDPKALFLRAFEADRDDPGLPGGAAAEVAFDLERTARSGLAISAILWDELASRQILPPRLDMLEDAARDGHILSDAKIAIIQVERGDTLGGVARLEALRLQDPTGFAAYLLALAYSGLISSQASVDLSRSRELVREAALKGYLPAINRLLGLQQDHALALSQSETAMLMARLRSAGREEGYWWDFDRLRLSGAAKDDSAALALLREMMVRFPKGDAAIQFARMAVQGIGGVVPADELLQALDQAIRAQSPEARTLRGEIRMGLLKGKDDLPILPIDPDGALSDLQSSHDLTGDPKALLLLARYYLLGVGGTPNPQAAEAVLRKALDDPSGAASTVWHLLASIRRMAALSENQSPLDVGMGPAQAPIRVTVLFDPDCPDCTAPGRLGRIVKWLRATYVQHGFVHLDLRPVSLASPASPALQAFACSNDRHKESVITRLFDLSNTAQPDAEPCTDALDADLIQHRNDERLTLLRSDVFAQDAAIAPRDLPGLTPAQSPPGTGTTLPAVVINGWLLSSLDVESLEITLYNLLSPAAQIRLRSDAERSCQQAGTAELLDSLLKPSELGVAKAPNVFSPLPTASQTPGSDPARRVIFCAGPQ